MPRLIAGLSEIANSYDVILSDIWGVVHNGAAAFAGAADALGRFRTRGGAVVLITNSPAPSRIVTAQLDDLGFPSSAYDAVVSSGDVTVSLLIERRGQSLFHIGAPQETGLFEEVAARDGQAPRFAPIANADFVLCTGFIDFFSETPEDYDERLKLIFARKLDFLCANPDLVVEVDGVLSYCAGAIAERYERLGGNVIQAGKPFAPIYDRALALAGEARGAPVERSRVLAIGDAMRTDIRGAVKQGFDSILVTSGIHREALHGEAEHAAIDAAALRQFVQDFGLRPSAAIAKLVW
ncbi:HAD-superfamily subfamily IIA hydrolase like protein [Methylocella silvestris BL2]|uniref:HAD-superfamily subfamily IIA hydrolase like protein n=1 Tax=Methylocella silvestris (strain DSM 15510 / CIP 108128 / LMG 27833 / NCIMB 13906 / BL2) TaxID=395965 RepID=B8EP64_METSB|nr:TIGR01459 family HAD-type hydrolase [Methylocella silvestris]ACK49652.1 HAD-superfamily subfamily IIA hydrolase like protein [Methylocella silvestris BL2]